MHVFTCVAVLAHVSCVSALWTPASNSRAVAIPRRVLGEEYLEMERYTMAEVHWNLSSSRCKLHLSPPYRSSDAGRNGRINVRIWFKALGLFRLIGRATYLSLIILRNLLPFFAVLTQLV
jgi:hypothetical protein